MSHKTTAATETAMNEFTTHAAESLKTLTAWQWKAGQTLFDHSLKMTQTWMDLSQETFRTSMATGEGIRKEWTSMTEKYFAPTMK